MSIERNRKRRQMMHSSHSRRWDIDSGQCFEIVNGGPETRRPDCDFGTPTGDLLIEPWMQELLREERKTK